MTTTLRNRIWIPFVAFTVLASVAWVLWQRQNVHDRELVRRYIETSVEQVRIRVEGLMNARLASLKLMADRWVEKDPPDFSRARFLGFAAALYKNYSGYSGIFWTDPSGAVQWVYPEDAAMAAIGRSVESHLHRPGGGVPDNPLAGNEVMVTPSVVALETGASFCAVEALMADNDLQGYLGGFFGVEHIMALCLTKEIMSHFMVSLVEEGRTIYRNGHAGRNGHVEQSVDRQAVQDFQASREIQFGPRTWTILLAMNPAARTHNLNQNYGFLAFGLALAAALSLLLHLLFKRMDMYKASRDQAIVEVNERKLAQAAVRQNERKLQALLAELTSKNAELESFAYTVSHDLKTPIVTIEGFIGALREDFGDTITEVGDQYLNHMSNAARKMELLINELLNYSRIGRLGNKKTSFPMTLPIDDAIATLRSQIETRGITVNVQDRLPAVYADRKRIEQVVYNLLSNAVKYIGRDNAEARIDIGFMQQNGENVFYIRDNGIGIDRRYYDKIFQIFERLPAAKQAGEGTGIGLAIVKRIIEHHGGRIWLDSQLGKGTTFYFTLKEKEAE